MQPRKTATHRRHARKVHAFPDSKYGIGYQTTAGARIFVENQNQTPLTRERRVQALKDALALEEQFGPIVQANDPKHIVEKPQAMIRW